MRKVQLQVFDSTAKGAEGSKVLELENFLLDIFVKFCYFEKQAGIYFSSL